MSISRILSLALVVLALAAGPAVAQEQPKPKPEPKPAPTEPSAEDLERAREAFLEGRRLIDEEENHAEGVKQFKLSYRLSRNPLLLYNIALALDELKQKNMALFYYQKFMSDAPEDAPNRDHATERIAVLEKEAKDEDLTLGATGAGTKDGGEKTTEKGTDPFAADPEETSDPEKKAEPEEKKAEPERPDEFQHKIVEEAPPNTPLDVTAFVPEGVTWQVTLYYRPQGEAKFETVPMKERYSELVGRIPAEEMKGTSMQYYIEARDQTGKVAARSGRSTSPNLVFIDEAAKPKFYPDLGEGGSDGLGGAGAGGFGGGGGAGGGAQRGPRDLPSDFEDKLRWGTTGAAAGSLTLAITFYFIAADASSSLEAEAFQSTMESCQMGPPCRTFSDDTKGLQGRGKTFETLTNVFFFTGLAAAGAAGYLWYRDIQSDKDASQSPPASGGDAGVTVVPVVGDDFVGGSASVRF